MFHVKRVLRLPVVPSMRKCSRDVPLRRCLGVAHMRDYDRQRGRRHAFHTLGIGDGTRLASQHLLLQLVREPGNIRKVERSRDQPALFMPDLRDIRLLPIKIDRIFRFRFEALGRLGIDGAKFGFDAR